MALNPFGQRRRPAPARRRHDRRENGRSLRADRLRARRPPRRRRRQSRPVGPGGRDRRPTKRRPRARARAPRKPACSSKSRSRRRPRSRSRIDAFDLAVVDDTGGFSERWGLTIARRLIRELLRILRPGGRVVAVGAIPQTGLGALLRRGPTEPSFASSGALHELLAAGGFRPVRTLAERDGLIFIEAAKPR